MLIVKMTRKEFDTLAHEELCKVCFEPLIIAYKNSMAEQTLQSMSAFKEQFYEQLTTGQQALFVFHMFYDHARKSVVELYWWSSYFYAQPKNWSSIKASVHHFQDIDMFKLLEEIESVLLQHQYPSSLEDYHITREDLANNKELITRFNRFHLQFIENTSKTIKLISKGIRGCPTEFVFIEE
ncbi:hypothetical protein [Cytobacillus sp. IB215316]|uniref:hypothetical protein n=1 Tax=Cytobacillus sp. IB215316 TaxID=3097354 RepID=UPI002A1580BF|nr:hypothetical protein [Cytobacillus sp. IB215316]MDX8361215.1 hypothetical protein [Cytobacillus sp. IB215316]